MLKYLKDHIVDEVEGAVDYMEKAIERKGTTEGAQFRKMSEMELEHANALVKMFRNAPKPEDMKDADYADCQKEVLNTYVDAMGKLEAMKALYMKV
jgi:hypothetical protein